MTQFLVIEELANIIVEVVKHFHLEQQRQLEWIEVLQKVGEISADDVHDRPREVEVSFFQELQEVSKANIRSYYPMLTLDFNLLEATGFKLLQCQLHLVHVIRNDQSLVVIEVNTIDRVTSNKLHVVLLRYHVTFCQENGLDPERTLMLRPRSL